MNGHTDSIYSLEILSSENVLSGSADQTIKLWSIDSGECLRTYVGHLSTVLCLRTLTEDRITSGSSDWTIKIWNVKTGDC